MISLDNQVLAEAARLVRPWTPSRALELAYKFGPAASWMLHPDLIRTALQDPSFPSADRAHTERFLSEPLLPTDKGACNPIFVAVPAHLGVDQDALRKSALREAFFLPLEWRQASEDDSGLPPELIALARRVRQDLGLTTGWSLWRNASTGLRRVDLSGLKPTCDSAWASLYVGLRLVRDGLRPKANVAVSAGWQSDEGVKEIGGIGEKCAVAKAFGCGVFFTTPAQIETLRAQGSAACALDMRALLVDEREPHKALAALLHEMTVPPSRSEGASLDLRLRYANGDWGRERPKREGYIIKEVTADLAADIAHQSASTREAKAVAGQPDRQVIVASSPSASLLSILLLRPKAVLILHTDQYLEHYHELPSNIRRHAAKELEGIEIEAHRVDPDGFESIRSQVRCFLSTAARAVVDVTGGKKGMTAAAALAGFDAGAVVVCVDQENPGLGGHGVGSEQMRVVAMPWWLSNVPCAAEKGTSTVFVTRHAGAREWAARRGLIVDRAADHIEPQEVQAGDTIIGSLPVSLAAEVCARGGRYLHLVLPLPPDCRGKELTADEMEGLGAYLREFNIKEVARSQ